MTMGQRIKECRAAVGLTLQQVGDAFSISRGAVSDWEHDKTRPDIEKLVTLVRLLKTTTDYLLIGRIAAKAEQAAAPRGEWPFSVSFERYEALSAPKKAQLDDRVSSFIDGASPEVKSRRQQGAA